MWIKKEEYDYLKKIESEYHQLANEMVRLRNELEQTKTKRGGRRSLGMIQAELGEQQKFPLE